MTALRMQSIGIAVALVLAVAWFAPRAATAWDCGACPSPPLPLGSVRYQLSGQSRIEVGCFAPCECPVLIQNGLAGSFVLVPYRTDPLFTEYLLCGIDWSAPPIGGTPAVHITGEGWYRVGGEVAVQQELRLCLSVNGGKTQDFESGLVPGGGFPDIDIAAATSGFFCWDSVVTVSARPSSAGIPADSARAFGIRARPNPSAGPVDFEVLLPRASRVSLEIVDVAGRSVRALVHDVELPAGASLLHWDGARSDGSPAAAGYYQVHLQADGVARTRSLIRLQ